MTKISKDLEPRDYQIVFREVKEMIFTAQQQFLQEANRTGIALYWQLGRLLAQSAERYQWGERVLARLSKDLTRTLSNARGYSEQNLRYMRQFYHEYVQHPELLEIENEMVRRIKEVIMMLGKGFAFIGNQYRIVAKNNEYFIDLLFFNRIIRALFAVELKIGKFKAEYAGKMNLYLGLLDDYVKQPDENPSIGLILCTNKNSIEADYALRDLNKPMGIAEIKLSKVLPKELIGKLPDLQELENEILYRMEEEIEK